MKYVFLVAWREYAENAKTRGFWIGLLVVPFIFFLSIQVPMWLQKKGTPTRYYVLWDQSKTLAPVIQNRLEQTHQRKVLAALNEYARKNANADAKLNLPSFEQFTSAGGEAVYLEKLQPQLRPAAPPFKSPRRTFEAALLPNNLSPDADGEKVIEQLRPFLRGEKKIEVAGQQVTLSAAILIPADIEKQIVRPKSKTEPGTKPPVGIEYWSGNLADTDLREELERAVNGEIRQREYLQRGLDAAAIREVEQTYAPISSLNPKKEAGQEAVQIVDVLKQWMPSAVV